MSPQIAALPQSTRSLAGSIPYPDECSAFQGGAWNDERFLAGEFFGTPQHHSGKKKPPG
jgi:hypothetical protein